MKIVGVCVRDGAKKEQVEMRQPVKEKNRMRRNEIKKIKEKP